MIVPIAGEADWLASLGTLPVWDVEPGPMVIVAPHPDDETLGAGGLIAARRRLGMDIVVAAVTDGENAYPNSPELAELRRGEQTHALARLGVPREKIMRFGLTDSDVGSREQHLVDLLMPLVGETTQIVAPWHGDFHPDHEVCGRAAAELARRVGASIAFYFFWTWHRGTTSLLDGLRLCSFPLDEELLLAKTEALLCHRSQLARESGEPILPELLLAPARRPFEVFLTS